MSEPDRTCTEPIKCCAQVMLGILLLAQGGVGLLYRDECPGEPFIPIYLVVMGGAVFLFCYSHELSRGFYFCWFLAGNICILSNYFDIMKYSQISCDNTLYLFALWTTILTDVLSVLLFCIWVYEQEQLVTPLQV